jgi:hypothetical protein
MYLDHDSLQSFVNQTASFIDGSATAMDANDNGTDLEWVDVLTNGNNPGMNVNYNGFSVFGIDSLTSTGVITADSLILTKDADITGKLSLGDSLVVAGAAALDSTLSVAGYTRVNDSLYVAKAALFAADVTVNGAFLASVVDFDVVADSINIEADTIFTRANFIVEETDFTWGVADSLIDLHGGFAYLRLSDSTHATYNTDVLSEIMMSAEEIVLTADSVKFLSTIEVYSATALDSSLSVAGVTTLSDSLIGVTANFSGTFDVTGAAGVDGDFDVNTDKFTVASATGNTAIAGTLDVTGVATLATVDINGGSIDGTTIGASTPSTVGATTIEASGDVTFNGDNFVTYAETSIHNNLVVMDNSPGTTTQFSVNEANGNTMIAGNLDLNGDLDLDGDSVDINVTKVFNVSAVDSIRLISSDEIVRIQSVDTNVFVTAGNDINLNAADDFQVDAADDIHFEVGEDFEVNVLSDIELHAQDDIHIHAGWPSTPAGEESYIKLEVDGVGGDSSLVKLDTALFDIRSANFKLDGNSELNGDLEVTGDVELGSDLVVFANVDVDGTVELHDALTVSGDTELDDALTVNGDTDLNGDLDVVGTTTFTGDVKGPRATGDDEFVTYAQLDSLSNTSPFNETYKVFKSPGSSVQTIQGVDYPGDTTRVDLVGAGIFTELSEAAEFPADNANQPFVIKTSGNTNTGHHMNLTDAGVYQYSLTMELKNVGDSDAFVTVAVQNFDALNDAFPTNTRTLASESEVIYKTGTFGESAYLSHHLNSTMFFETDNADEDIQIEIIVLPGDTQIEIVSYSFSVSQVGEE